MHIKHLLYNDKHRYEINSVDMQRDVATDLGLIGVANK